MIGDDSGRKFNAQLLSNPGTIAEAKKSRQEEQNYRTEIASGRLEIGLNTGTGAILWEKKFLLALPPHPVITLRQRDEGRETGACS